MLDFFRHAPQSPRAPSETDSRHSESSNGTEVSDTAALLEVMNGSARTSIRVVGARQSGKTSLVHALKGPPPSAASSATRTPVAVGLSIHPWEFQLETDERTSTLHVAVWDYTGNDDATARLASALSTLLSLRVVCVDARALLDAASSPVPTTGDANDRDVFADFVDASVLPWVQATTPRHQQQEEITLFLTKMDLVGAADETALTAAKQKLEDRIQSRLTAAIKRTQAAPSRVPIRWLAAQLVDVKTQLEMLVVQSDKSFSLPPGYQRGLDILDEMRAANAKVRRSDRASYSFIHVTKLVGIIRSKSPMLSDAAAREMLRKFHDLGDIVWFADGPEALRNVVVLDPRVLVDFVRVVVQAGKRDRNDEVMPHASLLGLMPWMALDDEHATAAIKQFMVHAQLAHTPRGETEWDSDLIVPSYWRSLDSWSTALASGPLSVSNADLKNAAPLKQVRWQYHFVGPLPQDFLELVLCESYSPLWHRAVHHNGVRFETDDDFACAVVVDQTIPDQCVVHLSAVAFAKDAPCWWIFQCAAEAIEKVLDSYGDAVLVSRSAVNDDDEPHRLETVAAYWAETSPAYRVTIAWLPPDLAWYQDIVVKRASSDGN